MVVAGVVVLAVLAQGPLVPVELAVVVQVTGEVLLMAEQTQMLTVQQIRAAVAVAPVADITAATVALES